MSEQAKHTPGPWTYSEQRGDKGHCFMAQVWAPDGKSLASVDSTIDPGEATATARLIAAAPDLLAALKYILPSIAVPKAYGRAKEAIAKAEIGSR